MGNIGPENRHLMQQTYRFLFQKPAEMVPDLLAPGLMSGPGIPTPGDILLGKLLLSQLLATSQGEFTPETNAVFVKNLLQIPKEIESVLEMLTSPEGTLKTNILKELLAEDPDLKISLEELQTHLGNQAQDAVQKLIKIIQSNNMSYTHGSQTLGGLIQSTSQLSLKIKSSPTEALTTLILLYLPWHPLTPPQKLELSFEFKENEEGGGGGSDAYGLVLFLETATLGKFKISMGLTQRTQLLILIEHDEVAKGTLSKIEAELNAAIAQDGVPTPAYTYQQRKPNPNEGKQLLNNETATNQKPFKTFQEDQKKLAIHPSEGVSVLVINSAYLLSRIIFEQDERNRLLQRRSYKK